ncbi:MAG: hypothetical protein WCO06_03380 [Candidatus Roizmanbacteria bacterium]
MKIEIDQSGKVEDTSKPTVLAFCNGSKHTIKIIATTKQSIQNEFRMRNLGRLFVYRTFATLVFLLIYEYLQEIKYITIDMEYPGHEKQIKDILLEMIRNTELPEPTIHFKRIGNHPPVHYLALNTYKNKIKADKIVGLREVMQLALKKDRGF